MMRALIAFAVVFCLLIAQTSDCWAQSAPSYNGKVNNAIGGVVQYKAGQEGFAANDNRVSGTMSAIGSGVGAFASTVVGTAAYAFVAGTAVAWLPVLAAAAAVGVGTALVTAGLQWAFGANGVISVSGSNAPTSAPAIHPGVGGYICGVGNSGATYGECVAAEVMYYNNTENALCDRTGAHCIPPYLLVCPAGGDGNSCTSQCAMGAGASTPPYYSSACGGLPVNVTPTTSAFGVTCPSGTVQVNYKCTALSADQLAALGYSNGPSTGTLAQVAGEVPASVDAQPLDPSLLASLINQQWQNAASQPGYQGLPYEASNPVTAADVAAWQAANPGAYPTVGDALAPVAQSATVGNPQPVKIPDPSQGGSPSTNPGSNPGTGDQLNLGPDPGIGTPGLEATPTATQIIAPLSGALPGLRGFTMPAHSSACPTGTITAFGKSIPLDAHCTILNNNAAAIQAGFLVFWSVAAILIILAA